MADIQGKKIAILATNGFEQSELEVPQKKLRQRLRRDRAAGRADQPRSVARK
jgi:hypothetical protein